ncbi:protein BTG2-like [Oppia nitens]|uniref:protein BTG2-like n=1 Tax=Oppia nitens TaxID=1686743 RepID=UPI0023DC27BD|nr:protein BTG2-like [Oppia nitens]
MTSLNEQNKDKMKEEIESAANFLSEFLTKDLPNLQIAEPFRQRVIAALESHYSGHWFPDRPVKGSAFRCLRINHKMDPLVSKVGQFVGLNERQLKQLFPHELTLWIDPREVSYRIGENGSICVIYGDLKDSQDRQSPQSLSSASATSSAASSPSQSPQMYFHSRQLLDSPIKSLREAFGGHYS